MGLQCLRNRNTNPPPIEPPAPDTTNCALCALAQCTTTHNGALWLPSWHPLASSPLQPIACSNLVPANRDHLPPRTRALGPDLITNHNALCRHSLQEKRLSKK
ncbi:hypothetical protein HBI56_096090 [Parastagonospora nodorum]|uniref:Uncharacterized protein n=1 Tax=Phaeosphaeria nodorum (strain SN15 / ATCC MYA-4574 / FGSC 10173) TaxID=321614 RepID=A0A7U2F8A1_PHANO|nr:hypothetical protein HBH56_091480 [Parastagonospora nodorum]QRC98300.1 hypothetical protein JI435_411840 [Parastagonospora nodorum SN15]KAH3936104.1 hypothetical protein HBH54_026120 [Parastagonospora nodorum]KAH3940461.1 hypothetical protein HBH53_216190 [Parastagonospora nodorum]KAH3957744.1 hypothetical protein HBH51_220990 [Parastagonospora nodorum]